MLPVLLAVGAVALIASRTSKSMATSSSASRADLERLVRAAASTAGVDYATLAAIVEIESRWRPDARNETGTDAARGGAYGLTQMTLRTAQALRPGTSREYLLTPEGNLDVAAQLMRDNARRSRDPKDLAAMWNSGKVFDKAPEVTRETYVPRFLSARAKYMGAA